MYLRKILFITAIIIALVGGYATYYVYKQVFSPNTAFNNPYAHLYIKTNSSYADVKSQLQNLLKDPESFDRVAHKKGYTSNPRPGHFKIKQGMNNNEIVNTLRSNNIPIQISFNNQETIYRLAGRIAQQIEADSLSLINAMLDPQFLEQNNFNTDNALAMYIPNTYEFFWNTTAQGFRNRMLTEYQNFWNQNRLEKAKKQNLTPLQVISLAAIVHRETQMNDERPKVAGVYLNRLQRNMLLQADPTVIYAIKKETGNYDTIIRRVLFRDLEINSPYNTYKFPGVPPGPITMPDLTAIEAVLNPQHHNYLFFVADVSNPGYHLFAQTLAQHNRYRQQYINWINSQQIMR